MNSLVDNGNSRDRLLALHNALRSLCRIVSVLLKPKRHCEFDNRVVLRPRRSPNPYGDIPLIVLTRGLSEETGPDGRAFEAEHRTNTRRLPDCRRMAD